MHFIILSFLFFPNLILVKCMEDLSFIPIFCRIYRTLITFALSAKQILAKSCWSQNRRAQKQGIFRLSCILVDVSYQKNKLDLCLAGLFLVLACLLLVLFCSLKC